jgi:hypothetical protein
MEVIVERLNFALDSPPPTDGSRLAVAQLRILRNNLRVMRKSPALAALFPNTAAIRNSGRPSMSVMTRPFCMGVDISITTP